MDIHVGAPPADVIAYNEELCHYQRCMYKQFQIPQSRDAAGADRTSAAEAYASKLEEHVSIWNGPKNTNCATEHGRIAVFVPRRVERSTHIRNMARTLITTQLHRVCTTPESGKWTKLGPSIDWAAAITSNNNIIERLLRESSAEMSTPVAARGRPQDDQAYQQSVNWHEVAGSRFKTACGLVHSEWNRWTFWCVAIAIESQRCLTAFFLKSSSESVAHCTSYVLNFLNTDYSPIVFCMQYQRLVARGLATRWRLLSHLPGACNMQA